METQPALKYCTDWRTEVDLLGKNQEGAEEGGGSEVRCFLPGKVPGLWLSDHMVLSWQVPSALWPQAEPQRYPVPSPGGLLSLLRASSAWKVLVHWFLQFQLSACWGLELMIQVSYHSDPCPRGCLLLG